MRRAIQEPEAFKLGEMVRKKKSFRKQQQQRDRIRFISSLSLSLFSQVDCPCFRQIHHVSDAPYILPFDRFGHPNIFFLCFFSPCFLTDNWDRLSSLSFCVLEVLNPVCLVRTAFPPPLFSLSPPFTIYSIFSSHSFDYLYALTHHVLFSSRGYTGRLLAPAPLSLSAALSIGGRKMPAKPDVVNNITAQSGRSSSALPSPIFFSFFLFQMLYTFALVTNGNAMTKIE